MAVKTLLQLAKVVLGTGILVLIGPFLAHAKTEKVQATALAITDSTIEESSSKKGNIFWKSRMQGANSSELLDQEQMVKFRLYGLGQYKLQSDLTISSEMQLRLDSGYSQVLYDESNTKNTIVLEEAKIHYNPKYVSLEAGALSQEFYQAPMLFKFQTFPAAREGVKYNTKQAGIGLYLQQAIPTSKALANQASEGEPMPRLAVESLVGYVKPTDNWTITPAVHRYSFFDLPSTVAADSRLGGNSVSGFKNATFDYAFQGFVYSLATEAEIWRVKPLAQAQYIFNQLADDGKNSGYWLKTELGVRVSGNTWVIPRFEVFQIESDTSPAYYNARDFQHNNRYGTSGTLEVQVKPWNMYFGGRYIETTPIEPKPYQGPSQTYLIEIGTDYASIF